MCRDGLDVRDTLGRTPLHHAAENGHLLVALMLIVAGADPYTRDLRRVSPQHLLSRYHDLFLEEEVNDDMPME
ncbi:Protein of unknown function [Gryllus bimaculatus]|nr:Protein of unknown function [Gryllus bimaculatus]